MVKSHVPLPCCCSGSRRQREAAEVFPGGWQRLASLPAFVTSVSRARRGCSSP